MSEVSSNGTEGLNRHNIPRFRAGQDGISAAHLNKIVDAALNQQRMRQGGTKIVNLPGLRIVSPLRK